jgi:flagella basal body P-ring formation protein FlgA
MSRAFYNPRVFALLVVLHGAAGRAQETAVGTEPVSIVLFPEAVVDDSIITLNQIAKLGGGSDALRKRLGKLDVAEFKLGAEHCTVTRDQIHFRLLLAGMDAARFQVEGARRTVVLESDEPATLRKILTAADQSLRAKYTAAAAAVTLGANKGLIVPVIEIRPGQHVRFEANVKAPAAQVGRGRVDVAILVDGKTREVVPVSFEIAEVEAAPKAAAREGIRAASYTAPALDSRDLLIKSGDSVKIFATIGSARLEAVGEALQDGRAGQMIRVRNVESNRTVHGRVEPNGSVLVEY